VLSLPVLIWLSVAFAVAGCRKERRDKPVYPKGEGNCQGCAYSLDGLPDGLPCPECGRWTPGSPASVRNRGVVPAFVLARISAALLLSILSISAYASLLNPAVRWSFRLQFGAVRASELAWVIRSRGLDINWEPSLVPISICGGLAIATGLLAANAKWIRPMLWLTLAGWIASVAWLYLHTWLTYG
jgi:hypothetical protein